MWSVTCVEPRGGSSFPGSSRNSENCPWNLRIPMYEVSSRTHSWIVEFLKVFGYFLPGNWTFSWSFRQSSRCCIIPIILMRSFIPGFMTIAYAFLIISMHKNPTKLLMFIDGGWWRILVMKLFNLMGIHKLPIANHGSLQNPKQGSLKNHPSTKSRFSTKSQTGA